MLPAHLICNILEFAAFPVSDWMEEPEKLPRVAVGPMGSPCRPTTPDPPAEYTLGLDVQRRFRKVLKYILRT